MTDRRPSSFGSPRRRGRAFGYSWLIELSAEERQAYERGGRAFLDWLAQDIHDGVPVLKVSTSPYKTRNRSVEYADKANRTV